MKRPSAADRRAQSLRNADALLSACKVQFENGNKAAVLAAVNWCASYSLPLPSWAALAFKKIYRKVVFDLGHKSWDEVFGAPPAKGKKNISDRLLHKKIWPDIVTSVWNSRAQGKTWDAAYAIAANKCLGGVGKTSVAKAIYHRSMREYFPGRKQLRKSPD